MKTNKNMVYLDPHIENKDEYFFKIKRKYLDEFWKMSDTEMLLLISLWQHNKKWGDNEKKYLVNNEEWRILNINGQSFEIAGNNNYRAMKKFEEIGIINIEGDKHNRKLFYDFQKQEGVKNKGQKKNGFINIPTLKIKNYLEVFGKTNIRTYIFLLYQFYNSYNHSLSKPLDEKYGVRKLIMSQKRIGEKINFSKKTVYRHMKKLTEQGFLAAEKVSARNQYYLPIIKDNNYYYNTKTGEKIKKAKVKTEKEELWEHTSGFVGSKKEIREKFNISDKEWEENKFIWVFPYHKKERVS